MPYLVQRVSLHRPDQAAEKLNELEAAGWEVLPPLLQVNQDALVLLHRRESMREAMDRREASKVDDTTFGASATVPSKPAKKPRRKKAA